MNESGDLLYQCMNEKLQILEELSRYVPEQSKLVSSGKSIELLRLLSDKQRSINALADVQRRLEPFLAVPPDRRTWSSESVRQKCLRATETCNAIGSDLLRMEKECEQRAQEQQIQLAKQLQEFSVFDSSSYVNDDTMNETHLASFDESS